MRVNKAINRVLMGAVLCVIGSSSINSAGFFRSVLSQFSRMSGDVQSWVGYTTAISRRLFPSQVFNPLRRIPSLTSSHSSGRDNQSDNQGSRNKRFMLGALCAGLEAISKL